MNTCKKLLASLLALLTVVSFAACSGGGEGGSTTSADTTASGGEETTAAVTEAKEYIKPDVSLDGKTFIYASREQPNPSWIARTYFESSKPEPNGDVINDAIYERALTVEEELGVTLQTQLYQDAGVMTKTVMAGDHFADMIVDNGNNVKSLLTSNMLTDLYEIPTLELDKSWWDQNAIDDLSIGGKLYLAAGDISPLGLLSAHCTFVNKGMIDSYNLDNPYDAVRDGTWTYDKMREMATVVASDVDGDGAMTAKDIFGLSGEGIGMAVVGAQGVKFTTKDDSDVPTLAIDEDRASAAVEKIVTLFRDKNITLYAADFSGYNNVFRDLIVEKFIADELMFVNNWLVAALELRNMESDFGILPPPKHNETQDGYEIFHSETWTTYAIVPKTVTDLEMVGYVMNALGHYGHEYIYTALIDTTITSKTLRDTDTEEMLDIIYNNRNYELAGIYNWGGISGMFNGFIDNTNTNFSSTYASNLETINAAITETVEAIQ